MKKEFIKLDHRKKPKLEIHSDKVRNEDYYAIYSARQFKNDDTDTFIAI
jgi:hypothetical protein